ncbi:unnamed protein product, partial [Prorocentrum cordatum]
MRRHKTKAEAAAAAEADDDEKPEPAQKARRLGAKSTGGSAGGFSRFEQELEAGDANGVRLDRAADGTAAPSVRNPALPRKPYKKKMSECIGCAQPLEQCTWAKDARWVGEKVQYDRGCDGCYDTFVCGAFDILSGMDFPTFCQVVYASETLKNPWEKALEKKNGVVHKPDTWIYLKPSEVCECTSTDFRAFVDKRGFTPAEFEAEFHTKSSDLGFKLQDLVKTNGQQYKGVLKTDEGEKLGTGGQHWRGFEVKRKETTMPEANTLYASQADILFKRMIHHDMSKRSHSAQMLSKLRHANLTAEEINALGFAMAVSLQEEVEAMMIAAANRATLAMQAMRKTM